MGPKEKWLKDHEPGAEFYFGSNINGFWDEDGSVYYNSHNLEQFYFDKVEDFLKFYFDEDKDVPHGYHYYIGERDLWTSEITYDTGYSKEDGIDPSEDGGMVWSEIIYKNQSKPRGHYWKEYKQKRKKLNE